MNALHTFVRTVAWMFLLWLGSIASAMADERILDYTVLVQVQPDASLEVTEHITVRAEGANIRRGIYRDFPTRYRDRAGNRMVVDIDVLEVTRDGSPEPWFIENLSNGIRINTGNDDFLPVPAEFRFTLRYRTTRQIGFFPEHDELYWNAIGTGWAFPIDAAQVQVRLPKPVPMARMSVEGYTGAQGAKDQNYVASVLEPGIAHWRLTTSLAPQEGLTIVLGFPKGLLPEPSQSQRIGWLLMDNRGVLIALFGLLALLVYCIVRWWQIGRDPRAGIIVVRYDPPEGHCPAELRFLKRGCNYDTRCFTADLLELAVDGNVQLQHGSPLSEEQSKALETLPLPGVMKSLAKKLQQSKKVWSVKRLAPPHRSASTAAALLDGLLPQPESTLVFKQENHPTLQGAIAAHKRALNQRLDQNHFHRNGGSLWMAILIAVVSGVLAFTLSGGAGTPLIILVCGVMFSILMVFARLIPAPTREGRRLLDEIEGLRRYLGVAERDELKHLPGPGAAPPLDAERYQRLLPYAVALDVEEAWTKHFTLAVGAAAAAATTAGLAWCSGGSFDSIGSLANAVGNSLSNSIASASTPPGSSSGGGGGGSSGGGGGGGGGGGR
ncbi:DUF2207 domain-containing protein [Xanthomonadaceae bacterium XH05]|nr:DUF2207 domain-containing protein [Xanthomonadaceae bacterium XH05]